ncbi:MAG: hypothetical protein GPI93_17780 [Microcystis aeruginosa LG13-12]|nr:hypothetical protein [Microcystis aeruginosa LG13-12]NCS01885.1 hypothetical protein [Microcystis aeruginosa G13-11]NCS76997.1 hypothetical protein [Microcystis aeruginosa K13-07]
MKINKTLGLFSMMLTSSIMLSSCGADPAIKSAQEFGAMSAQFRDNTNKLADDIYDSCIRRVQYYRTDINALRQQRNQAWQGCEQFNKPAASQARVANQVVVDYMEAIGKLSSDSVVSFENEFNNVETALKGLSIPTSSGNTTLPSSAVDTGKSIANFIFNWAAKSFRKGTLTEAITCTNKPLQTYTDGLEFAFREGYINGILQQELDQAKLYYDDYAAIAEAQNGAWRDFNNLTKESYNAIVPILQRRNAALSYITIIDKTANTHAQLAVLFLDGREPPSSESESCKTYLKPTSSDSNTLNSQGQSNLNMKLTPEELAQVSEILINYRNEVRPLLKQMEEDLKDK